MKSYIQGFITGGVFVFAFLVFMGQTSSKEQRDAELKKKMDALNKVQSELDELSSSIFSTLQTSFDKIREIEYKIINGNKPEVEQQVNLLNKHGWVPLGGVSVSSNRIWQAVVK